MSNTSYTTDVLGFLRLSPQPVPGTGGSAIDANFDLTSTVLQQQTQQLNTLTQNLASTANGLTLSLGQLAGSLATVATSGSYTDLSNKPTLGTAAAHAATDFDAAGSAAAVTASLSSYVTSSSLSTTLLGYVTGSSLGSTLASYATNTALSTHAGNTSNPHSTTAVQVGAMPLPTTTVSNVGQYLRLSSYSGGVATYSYSALATVATTGSYTDLSNKPTLGTAAAATTGTGSGNVPVLGSGGVLPVSTLGSTGASSTTYLRGDQTWQTLTATTVGLGNVPNVNATNATNITTGTLAAARLPDLSGTYLTVSGKAASATTADTATNCTGTFTGTLAGHGGSVDTEITITLSAYDLVPTTVASDTPTGMTLSSNETAAWQAFAGQGWTTTTLPGTPAYIQVHFNTPQIVNAYQIANWPYGSGSPSTWLFQCSSDGTSWTTLDSQTAGYIANQTITYPIGSPAAHYYYRIYFTAAQGNWNNYNMFISQFRLFGGGSMSLYSAVNDLRARVAALGG